MRLASLLLTLCLSTAVRADQDVRPQGPTGDQRATLTMASHPTEASLTRVTMVNNAGHVTTFDAAHVALTYSTEGLILDLRDVIMAGTPSPRPMNSVRLIYKDGKFASMSANKK